MEEEKLVDLSASFEGFGDDYRFSAYKTLVTDNFEARRIKVKQDMSLGTGGILWDSAYVLSKYLDLYLGDLRSKKVIELGAGCALPSIIACSKGAEVVATDIEPTLNLTRTNLGANSALFSGTYSVHTLDWRHLEDVDSLPHTKYDLVLMSDVFYLPVCFIQSLAEQLVATLSMLCLPDTQLFLTYKYRTPHTVDPFLEALRGRFQITELSADLRSIRTHSLMHLCKLNSLAIAK